MAITTAYSFDSLANYLASNITTNGLSARLSFTSNPSQVFSQDFSSSSGFTFNALKSEFSAGVVRQIDQRPANATFYASYASSLNANWGGGSLLATNTGGVLNTSTGRLELLGGVSSKYVDYDAASNANSQQVGCVRLRVIPNYSGSPSTTQIFYRAGNNGNNNNAIGFQHSTAGQIALRAFNSTAGSIITVDIGAWSPVAGQEYELEFNWDLTTGATRFFIDGVQLGATQTQTGTRTSTITLLRVGEATILGSVIPANFSLSSLLVFSTVQHTANYTPNATIPEAIYETDTITLPTFSHAGVGSVLAFTAAAITDTGSPGYILNGLYWNGSSWVASNNTYAQSATEAQVLANIAGLPANNSVIVKIIFPGSNTQNNVDNLSLTYTGQAYTTSGYIEPIQALSVQELLAYSQDSSSSSGNSIGVVLKIDGVLKYFNGSSWVSSDGTIAQSSTPSQIDSNLSSLSLGQNSSIIPRWIFSSDGVATSTLTGAQLIYDFGAIATTPPTCTIYGYLKDITGSAVGRATLTFTFLKSTSVLYKEAGSNILVGSTASTTTDTNGYFEISLIRSSAINGGATYSVKITSLTGEEVSQSSLGGLEFSVPDADFKDMTDLL